VVAAAIDPTAKGDGFTNLFGAQLTAIVGTHGDSEWDWNLTGRNQD
jgi:hypothetical protein